MTRRTAATALAAVFVFLLSAPSAKAQYMYLDSNGDGIHDASDVMAATGTTTVDVWIVTDQNRDGSTATCAADSSSALTINSYEFFLRADGGTVNYGPVQDVIGYYASFGEFKDMTDLYAGRAGAIEPPGRYLLARVPIERLSGNPAIRFVEGSSINPPGFTSFGCNCPGLDQDNTMKLGQDWHDADGLAAEGVSSYAPTFAAMGNVTIYEGATVSYTIVATDPDSDSLQMSANGLPSFASWAVTSSSKGRIEGRLTLAPTYADAGTYTILFACSDGTLESTAPLRVMIRELNPAPKFDEMSAVTVVLGSVEERAVTAHDPDRQPLTIRLKSAPPFVTLGPTEAISEAYRAVARVAPGPSDAGDWEIRLEVTDGTSVAAGSFRVYAFDSSLYHPPSIDSIPDFTLAEGDTILHEVTVRDPDNNSYLLFLSQSPPFVEVRRGYTPYWYSGEDTLFITPGPSHAGTWEATLVATDYSYGGPYLEDQETFGITVTDRPFPPLIQTTPLRPCVEQGEVYSLLLRVSDPDGDPFTVSFGPPPPWGTATLESATSCRYELAPTSAEEPGTIYLSAHTVDAAGTGRDVFATVILARVWECPRGDVVFDGGVRSLRCEADAPTTAVVGTVVSFDGAAIVDPPDVLLRYEWNFGDGATALGREVKHAYGTSGVYRAVLTVIASRPNSGYAARDTVEVTVREPLPARAFAEPGEAPIVLRSGRPLVTLRLERVGDEYALEDIAPGSFCLWSAGYGELDSIPSQGAKAVRVEDRDRNGSGEMAISFAREDVRRLFSAIRGRHSVPARLQGRLSTGAHVRAWLDLDVLGTPARAVTVRPNPMNPRGVIAFEMRHSGQAVVRLYDVGGRLVRTLFEGRAEAGELRVPIDGRDARGRQLASGVYYYQITAGEDSWRGRATILK